ncbi:unnamed protein product [Rotaria sp. Silwood1]|nr:unnamed protein product [Rotaria sp. Silwood1]CAF4633727.1 unnamed protein product [Rotaria sp. Silwood1]
MLFFLLGHNKNSTTYTVPYARNTHEECEVNMERFLFNVFYNRNCYDSLYRVEQKDDKKQQPLIDLDHSVDRTYMAKHHQSQFIGQDLLLRFHLTVKIIDGPDDDFDIVGYELKHTLNDKDKLIDSYINITNDDHGKYDPSGQEMSEHETFG